MKTFVLVVAALLAPLTVHAKTLYVDRATGNDATTYAGNSASSPWATIGRAAWGGSTRSASNPAEAARAGDIVIVNAGTYVTTGTNTRYDPAYNPVNSGTASQRITFQANGTVTLTYSSGVGPVIGAMGRHYITWQGFTINEVNAPSTSDTGPVVLWECVGGVIEGNTIVGRGDIQRHDNYPGIRLEGVTDAVIRNNRVSNILPGVNSPAVQLYRSGRVIFENNEFFNVGTGIAIKGTAEPEWNDWFVVRYNLMYNAGTAGVWVHRAGNNPRIDIYQNVVRDTESGIMLHHFGDWTEPRNLRVVNNTFNHNTFGVWVQWNSVLPNANNLFQNNIIANSVTGGTNFSDMSADNVTTARYLFRRNVYFATPSIAFGIPNAGSLATWQSTYGQDANSIVTNPLFVNTAGLDFKLQSGSPARTVGLDVLDLNRNGSTSDVIPAGAYILGNEVIGRTTGSSSAPPTDSPAPPSNLRIIS